jgi:LuxR family maltose regulon positive regulatory protein
MPKAAAYRLTWLPEREVYELCESQSNQVLPVAPGSHAWFAWLAAVPSFTFSGQAGQLTVRQEVRPRGGAYWYACRRTGEKMAKRYLGRTSELTLARLEEIAGQFTAPAVSHPEQEGPTHRPSQQTTSVHHDADSSALPSALPAARHDLRLATKLAVPRLRPKLVHRARLLTHLEGGRQATLTLVSAPAGSGKTTLLTQWLAQGEMAAAWLSLEPADNEPVRFLSALIAALQRLHPQIGTAALALLHTPPPSPVLATGDIRSKRAYSTTTTTPFKHRFCEQMSRVVSTGDKLVG